MKEEELDQILKQLNDKHFLVKKDWLKVCIEFIQSQIQVKSIDEMIERVIEQFLNSEISETYIPSIKIPINASKVVITKNMIFQIISVLNISTSLYEQLSDEIKSNNDLSWFHGSNTIIDDEINNEPNNNEIENKKKKRGIMKIELTDGINRLNSFEFSENVFDLNQLVPGAKMIFIDKVRCKKGLLFIDRSNCQILGGSVKNSKFNLVEKLANILKIDLEAENKRKKIALEKAKEMRQNKKQKKNLTQSTISPFLIKKDKKTNSIDSQQNQTQSVPLICESSKSTENNQIIAKNNNDELIDDSFEIIEPQIMENIGNETVFHANKETGKNPEFKKSNLEKDEHQKETDIESWTFTNKKTISEVCKKNKVESSNLETNPKCFSMGKKSIKSLPEELLKDTSQEKNESENGIEIFKPEKLCINSLTENQEKVSISENERKLNSSGILTMGTIQKTLGLNKNAVKNQEAKRRMFEALTKNIHGPRGIKKTDKKNSENDSEKLITNFFNTVKNLKRNESEVACSSKLVQLGIVTPVQKQKNLNSEQTAQSSFDQTPKKKFQTNGLIVNEDEEDEEFEGTDEEEEIRNDQFQSQPSRSIMNYTIEADGQKECERWGVEMKGKNEKKRKIIEKFEEEEEEKKDEDILQNWNPEIKSYKITRMDPTQKTIETQIMNIDRFSDDSNKKTNNFTNKKLQEKEAQHFNLLNHLKNSQNLMFPVFENEKKQKIEERRRVSVIRQSENVQFYKTPLAQRVPSAENSLKYLDELLTRFSNLHVVPLKDALLNRKYWMMSKIVVIMPTICHQMQEIQSDGVDWQLKMRISDTTLQNVVCVVSTDVLNRLFGFTVQQCKSLFDQGRVGEVREKKLEAERKLKGFNRLDLVVWIEVSPQIDKCPLIIDVKTISDAINIL